MSKDADIKQFVPSGTALKCSYCSQSGMTPVKLMGGNPMISIYGEAMMTEKDMIVGTNIVGVFPSCGAPSNTLKVCAPVVTKPWVKNADPQITSNKVELLVNDSYVLCDTYFGEISPVMDDPVDITAAEEDAEGKDLPIIENPIDALKEKINGAVDAITTKMGEIQEGISKGAGGIIDTVIGPIGKDLNNEGVQNTIQNAQVLVGKAQKYKNKAGELLDSPNAIKEKVSSEILGAEAKEKKGEKQEEEKQEEKSLQEKINDSIGALSAEVEEYKQEVKEAGDENFVVEGLGNVLEVMNESVSGFRHYLTESLKVSPKKSAEVKPNGIEESNTNPVYDKLKEEYDDVKGYKEEYDEYEKEAEVQVTEYKDKLKEVGQEITKEEGEKIGNALMLMNWIQDRKEVDTIKPLGITTESPANIVASNGPGKETKATPNKSPGKVRTKVNEEVTGYIDRKLEESGINEDVKEAKEDLEKVQKDIDRAKKYLTITSKFNDAVKGFKEAITGQIGAEIGASEIGEGLQKLKKKQAYIANYMGMASSGIELAKFALSGFATSPGSVVTRVDDGRGKDTDDDPNSDDFGNFAADIHGSRFGIDIGGLGGEGSEEDNEEGDKNLEPKILRLYVTDLSKKEMEKSATVAVGEELFIVIQANGKANGETAQLDLKEQLDNCKIIDNRYIEDDISDGITKIPNINGASPNFEAGEDYKDGDSSKTTTGKTLADKTYVRVRMIQPEDNEEV